MSDWYHLLCTELRYPIYIDNNGCWIFTGGSKNGFHGTLYYKGRSWRAHRLTFTLTRGEISEGQNALHEFDVGMCINPDHLFLRTQTNNVQDMSAKGQCKR